MTGEENRKVTEHNRQKPAGAQNAPNKAAASPPPQSPRGATSEPTLHKDEVARQQRNVRTRLNWEGLGELPQPLAGVNFNSGYCTELKLQRSFRARPSGG